jgi:predicted kinase
MQSFKTFLVESELERIDEKLITIGKARPKYNQVVIMAGGAGSGKGFVREKLLGIDGKVFDVDEMKALVTKAEKKIPKIKSKVNKALGTDATELSLKDPDNTSLLHGVLSDLGFDKMVQKTFMGNKDRNKDMLPNLIFDVTMKEEKKLKDISDLVQKFGYKKENIHIVWILTPTDVAREANKLRPRVVKDEIVFDIHKMVASTMANLIKDGNLFRAYLDGDVWVVFNNFDPHDFTSKIADMQLQKSKIPGSKGSYVKEAIYFKVKEKGKPQMPPSAIADEFLDRIKRYVPKEVLDLWDF